MRSSSQACMDCKKEIVEFGAETFTLSYFGIFSQ
jgi:hypothetical protein